MKTFFICLSFFVSLKCWSKTAITLEHGHYYRTLTTQVGLYHFIDDKTLIGFKLGEGKEEDSDEIEKQFNFTFDYKKFQSETFYAGVDLSYYYYNEIKKKEDFVSNVFDPEDDFHALGLMIRIGNEWRLSDDFSIGCDWFGVGYARVVSNRTDREVDTSIHFVLLNVHVGYRF